MSSDLRGGVRYFGMMNSATSASASETIITIYEQRPKEYNGHKSVIFRRKSIRTRRSSHEYSCSIYLECIFSLFASGCAIQFWFVVLFFSLFSYLLFLWAPWTYFLIFASESLFYSRTKESTLLLNRSDIDGNFSISLFPSCSLSNLGRSPKIQRGETSL